MDGDEVRWRPPSCLMLPLVICGGLIFFVDVLQLQTYPTSLNSLPRPRFMQYSKPAKDLSLKGFLIKTDGCRIPDMDAFDKSIKKYIFSEDEVKCNNGKPALFESNVTHIYLLNSSLYAYKVNETKVLKCCYSVFKRKIPKKKESDVKVTFNKKCMPFHETCKIEDEFIRVSCDYKNKTIYKDFFSFAPIKPHVVKKKKSLPLNVLVIGIDAVSRLNFHRQMPKTIEILENLNAVELLGYNKVADNTFPNLIPVLTGLNESELITKCFKTKKSRFDDCSFVWQNYSRNGYATAFGEDSAWMGIFNYLKQGFGKQPTDYYWDHFNYESEHQIGNSHRMNVEQCVGARMVHNTLLRYVDTFVNSMRNNKTSFFGFFWSSSLSHDYLNKPKLGDKDFAKLLLKLQYSGALNDTVLMLMSDHGIRWGDIRTTYQGRMEERLPFLFVALPEKYGSDYFHLYNNLRKNARKLTTPFDLHETLKALVDPYALTADKINKDSSNGKKRRGYSLFEPIPLNRTCEDAGIESHWCTCQQSNDIDKNDTVVLEATKFTVQYINQQLVGYADCQKLSLAEIYNARSHSFMKHILVGKAYIRDFTIAFRTTPGDAIFEVTIRQHVGKDGKNYTFSVTGTISRINLYGTQSLCVTDFHLKLYCYCKT